MSCIGAAAAQGSRYQLRAQGPHGNQAAKAPKRMSLDVLVGGLAQGDVL